MRAFLAAPLAALLLCACGSTTPTVPRPSAPHAQTTCHPRSPAQMGECVAQQYRAEGKLKAVAPRKISGPQGVDVSVWQGYPDWSEAKRHGLTFVINQATELGYADPNYVTNTVRERATGLAYDAYMYLRPGCAGADYTADLFASVVKRARGFQSLPPMLDQENDGCLPHNSSIAAYDCAVANRIRHDDGWSTVLLYTSPGLWSGLGRNTCGMYLVLADWGGFQLPEGWTHAVAQQYCGMFCTFPGISGYVDRDVSYSLLSLRRKPEETRAQKKARLYTDYKRREALRYDLLHYGCRSRVGKHESLGPKCKAWYRQGGEVNAAITKLHREGIY